MENNQQPPAPDTPPQPVQEAGLPVPSSSNPSEATGTVPALSASPLGQIAQTPLTAAQAPLIDCNPDPNPTPSIQPASRRFASVTMYLAFAMAGLVALAHAVTDAAIVQLIMNVMWFVGAVFSIAAGIWTARKTAERINAKNSGQSYTTRNLSFVWGLLVFILGAYLFNMLGIGIYPAVLAGLIVMIVLAVRKQKIHPPTSARTSDVAKVMLVGLSVFAGLIPAVILSLVCIYIVFLRWCDVSGSKCI